MIQPYVTGNDGERENYTQLSNKQAFETAIETLKEHIENRQKAAKEYLQKP